MTPPERHVRIVVEFDLKVIGTAELQEIVGATRPMLLPALAGRDTCIVEHATRVIDSEEIPTAAPPNRELAA